MQKCTTLTFESSEPPAEDAVAVSDPQGQVPEPFSFSMSSIIPTNLTGGSVKIVDSTVFNVSKQIAVAEVTVNPGGLRELHVSTSATAILLKNHALMLRYSGIRLRMNGPTFCKILVIPMHVLILMEPLTGRVRLALPSSLRATTRTHSTTRRVTLVSSHALHSSVDTQVE
jgi:hypothetical protein